MRISEKAKQMKKWDLKKVENFQTFNFDECSKYLFIFSLFYLRNIIYLDQIMRDLLSNKNAILHFWKIQ